MASAVATDFTNQIVYTDEVADFSPEVVAEMESHLVKYPPDRKRSASDSASCSLFKESAAIIDNGGVNFLAQFLDLEVTDIWETATFYSMFNMRPVGKYHIQVCKTLSCRIMGEPEITGHICNKLGIHVGETTEDKMFTVSRVECLGSCGTAPMMQIGFDYHEDLTTEKVDRILDSLK